MVARVSTRRFRTLDMPGDKACSLLGKVHSVRPGHPNSRGNRELRSIHSDSEDYLEFSMTPVQPTPPRRRDNGWGGILSPPVKEGLAAPHNCCRATENVARPGEVSLSRKDARPAPIA
jgi:hypothetical protein